jgi:hypothetical protein
MTFIAKLAHRLRPEWTENWHTLRRIADVIGEEFESLPYDDLCGPADGFSGERTIDGLEVEFSAHVMEIRPNGDAQFWIDVDAPLATWFGAKPSYQFFKRPDGSVHYG